jgi:nicotinate-nucleotide adenylyltransferase
VNGGRGRRVGVLGGSFDPPHIGHLILAQEAWWGLGLDEVRLVPAARSPLKDRGPAFGAEARCRMVARAIEGHAALTLSRAELDRGAPSYTVDTLEGFAAAEPEAALWLVLGGDQLLDLGRWREPARIVTLARLAVAARADDDRGALRRAADALAPGRVDWIDMPRVDVSSTMVRERLRAGAPVRYLLPPGVEEVARAAV